MAVTVGLEKFTVLYYSSYCPYSCTSLVAISGEINEMHNEKCLIAYLLVVMTKFEIVLNRKIIKETVSQIL